MTSKELNFNSETDFHVKYPHKWHFKCTRISENNIINQSHNVKKSIHWMIKRYGVADTVYALMHGLITDGNSQHTMFTRNEDAFIYLCDKFLRHMYNGKVCDFLKKIKEQSPLCDINVSEELELRKKLKRPTFQSHYVCIQGDNLKYEDDELKCSLYRGCDICKSLSQREKAIFFSDFCLLKWKETQEKFMITN